MVIVTTGLFAKDAYSCFFETLFKELYEPCVNRSLSPPNAAAPASVPQPIAIMEPASTIGEVFSNFQRCVDAVNNVQELVKRREEAALATQNALQRGMRLFTMPTQAQVDAAVKRIQYNPAKLDFDVCSTSNTHKSSLIHSFRGLLKQHEGAASSRFAWHDISGPGTMPVSDWHFFIDKGLFVFDFIVMADYVHSTKIGVGIIESCCRFHVPVFIVRSKARIRASIVVPELEKIFASLGPQIPVMSQRPAFYPELHQAGGEAQPQAEPAVSFGPKKASCITTKRERSRLKGSSKYFGVRFRPNLGKLVAEIRVAEWKSVYKVWLGTFDTEERAARAVDSARRLVKCKQKRPFNFPCDDLNAYSEEIPSNLNLKNLSDNEVTLFVKRKAQEYAAGFCPNKTSHIAIGSRQEHAKDKPMEQRNVEEKFAKLQENAYLKAHKVDLTGDGSMCPSLESDENELLNVPENEDDELHDGSSATDASDAEVTADSPCLESSSNYGGRKRKSADDDDLITKLAPFIKQQIEDALNSTLLPLVSVLRSREEDEQKHRESMLVLEEQKLALKREKLRFKRRSASLQFQPGLRASYSASSEYRKHGRGLRAKTSAR